MAFPQARATRARSAASPDQGAARRRVRRAQRLYCATNGCTSFLETDETTGIATCPICGYRRGIVH